MGLFTNENYLKSHLGFFHYPSHAHIVCECPLRKVLFNSLKEVRWQARVVGGGSLMSTLKKVYEVNLSMGGGGGF